MNRCRFPVTFALFAVLAIAVSAAAQQPSDTGREYIDQLKQARKSYQTSMQGLGKQAVPMGVNEILAVYDDQIKRAEDRVAAGGIFGATEFADAIKLVQAQSLKAIENAHADLVRSTSRELAAADRQRMESQQAAMQKRNAVVEASNEKFRITRAEANLKFQFATAGNAIGIVIWNLPLDQKLHRRFTPTVNLRLYKGKKALWSRSRVPMSTRQVNNPIRLPKVLFDRVTIELPKWKGEGNGLAEVQVFFGKTNVALGRPCEVSSIETLPLHLDDQHALTDGITRPEKIGEGYWIPEERSSASVSIHLTGETVPTESLEGK
mgnify:CR=1 FL=1|tara:strand:- start:137568 stop:138530 length:963 start_codon:yes stop_codon:yes gene_type:complete